MYIGKILDQDLNFNVEKELTILIGECGSGKTLTLIELAEYFKQHGENVLYFPSERYFNLNPIDTKEIINGYLVMEKLIDNDQSERYNSKNFNYDLNNLLIHCGQYINSGIIQWINFMGNILMAGQNVVVLIDTPETNLDVETSSTFIKDIKSLGNIKKLIICTHSPDIIGDNYLSMIPIEDCIKLYG